MKQIDIYELQVGDIFIEDCTTDKYKVLEMGKMVKCLNLNTGEVIEFGYNNPSYAPTIFLV